MPKRTVKTEVPAAPTKLEYITEQVVAFGVNPTITMRHWNTAPWQHEVMVGNLCVADISQHADKQWHAHFSHGMTSPGFRTARAAFDWTAKKLKGEV